VLDEVLLIGIEFGPVLEVLSKIYFFGGPEAGHLVLVHLPDVVVLDWEQHKSVWVLLKKWFWQETLSLGHLGLALLGCSLANWNLRLNPAMLAVVIVDQLGAHLVYYGLLRGLHDVEVLGWVLASLNWLLLTLELLLLRQNFGDFLLVS